MVPTAVFKSAKSRETMGPVFSEPACLSVRSTACSSLAAGLPVSQPDETPAPEQRGAADHNHGEQDRTGSRQLPESTHSKVPNFATRFMTLCDSVLCDAV
jgi:hypothetical protein